jgi:predicted phage terminase large subunit-like protein
MLMMKLPTSRREFAALLRNDLPAFIHRSFLELNPTTEFKHNWHLEVIAHELEQVRRGINRRLIINVPPRSLKSHSASVAFPAWLLGHDPSAQIICASYAQDLSNKLASDCRTLMMSQTYKQIFNTQLLSQRPSLQELITTRKGFRLATSVGGVLTGRGADYLIIDDPLKPEEALSETERQKVNNWFDHTLLTRLNDKRQGRIIVIMQRLHEDDLVGHLLRDKEFSVLRFPAIADRDEVYTIQTALGYPITFRRKEGELLHPEREDRATLDALADRMGSYNFTGQYQQSPSPPGGGLIKENWFKRYHPAELPLTFDVIFQSWDTANKPGELSDYTVCTTWGKLKHTLYLLNVYRKRVDYPTLKRAVVELGARWQAKVQLIEDKASGTQLIQDLIYEGVPGIRRYEPPPGQNKIMRMHSSSSSIENGFVYLPEKAEWLGEYLHEFRLFPKGKHDDQVDSTSQALDWVRQVFQQGPQVTFSVVRL